MNNQIFRMVLSFILGVGCGSSGAGPKGGGGVAGQTSIGGGGAAGVMGSGGRGGAGLGSACQQIEALDRSCVDDADCALVLHKINCCGAAVWIGVRAAELQPVAALENACDASYPFCGCASGPPTTDDGSALALGNPASVSCQGGTCKTFAPACGRPCGAGRSCLTCKAQDASVSVCSLRCSADTDCREAAYPQCQSEFGAGICAEANLACASP